MLIPGIAPLEKNPEPAGNRLQSGKKPVDALRMQLVQVKKKDIGHLIVMFVLFPGEGKIVYGIAFVRKDKAVLFGYLYGIRRNLPGKIICIQAPDDFLGNLRIKFYMVGGKGPVGLITQDPPVKDVELGL